jgi:hypothetical protein
LKAAVTWVTSVNTLEAILLFRVVAKEVALFYILAQTLTRTRDGNVAWISAFQGGLEVGPHLGANSTWAA